MHFYVGTAQYFRDIREINLRSLYDGWLKVIQEYTKFA